MTLEPRVLNEDYKTAVFLGSKRLGLNIFKSILAQTPNIKWTIIHPDDELDERSKLGDFRNFARETGIELLVSPSAKTASTILHRINPDIGIVCGWYWLLDENILESIKGGLWGIHNSLLPRYRGGSPLVWSILEGDEYVGATVFKISSGLDNGPILHQVRFRMKDTDDISTALLNIENGLVAELPRKWLELISNKVELTHQDEKDATFCGQRSEEDGLIDWGNNARSIHNFIRAQAPPYPSAFSFLAGEKVEILKSKLFDGIFYGTPGQVLSRSSMSIVVSCGENTAIEILELRIGDLVKAPNKVANSIRLRFKDSI
jgi:methionyl-tRNA formyltransferase